MPSIKLFELGPTRSARVRWMLLEAELTYDSAGNSVEVFRNAELRRIHPLGKLPAAIIDGKPLFESAAIVTAIADLVPEKGLIAGPGTWSRNLHYQVGLFRAHRDGALRSQHRDQLDRVRAAQKPARPRDHRAKRDDVSARRRGVGRGAEPSRLSRR
jgi:glutathione S-transferase